MFNIKQLIILLLFIPLVSFALRSPSDMREKHRDAWIQLEQTIDKSRSQTVYVEWSGIGGDSTVMYPFIEWLHQTRKKVVLVVDGEAISVHANIVCQANFTMKPGSKLIFHSFFIRGKHKQKLYYFARQTRAILSYCVARDILTNNDVDLIIDQHKRVIVNADGSKIYKADYP